jgi:hypothetical protein
MEQNSASYKPLLSTLQIHMDRESRSRDPYKQVAVCSARHVSGSESEFKAKTGHPNGDVIQSY